MRNPCGAKKCVIHPRMSTGRKSMEFISSTHRPTVSAVGAMNLRSPWKMSFAWLSTNSKEDLDEGLALAGHAGVAPRTPPEKTETHDTEQRRRHQRIHVQRPERAFSNRVLEETQVMADVGGRRQFMLAAIAGSSS